LCKQWFIGSNRESGQITQSVAKSFAHSNRNRAPFSDKVFGAILFVRALAQPIN
jgi:hypothetical protein